MAHVALGSGRWREANSLFARAAELAGDASKRHQECERVDELAIERLDELVVSTRAFRAVAAAEDALEAAQRDKEASEGVERMSIGGEVGYNTREAATYLAEDWDAERSFVGESKSSIRIARYALVWLSYSGVSIDGCCLCCATTKFSCKCLFTQELLMSWFL